MRKKWLRLIRTLFPKHLALQEKLNRIVMLLVFVSSVTGIILALPGADPKVLYSLVPICVISGLSIWLTLTRNGGKKACWLLVIGTNA